LIPPADGWNDRVFYIMRPQVFPRPPTPIKQGIL